MPAFGRIPGGFVEGQQEVSAREMTNWVETTRALAASSGLAGASGYRGAGGAAIAVRPTPKYPVVAPVTLVWVRVTGYDDPNNPTVYRGRRVSPDTEGDLADPQGFKWSYLDEEDIDLHIVRSSPGGETDVRAYWPRLLARGVEEWWGWAMPTMLAMADDVVERLYIVPPFGVWCEKEAQPGRPPRFEVPGVPPGPPVLEQSVRGATGGGDEDLQRLIDEQQGGRPCGGCEENDGDRP